MDLTPIFIVGFIVLGIYKVIELFVRRRERILIIEKFSGAAASMNSDALKAMMSDSLSLPKSSGPWSTLKWASLALGMGLGIFGACMLDVFCLPDSVSWTVQSSIFSSLALIGAGLGLLIAFLCENRARLKDLD